jgi:hypothetical protein
MNIPIFCPFFSKSLNVKSSGREVRSRAHPLVAHYYHAFHGRGTTSRRALDALNDRIFDRSVTVTRVYVPKMVPLFARPP